MSGKVIVTGGAGYLGRCVAEILSREGFQPILVDNFSTSRPPSDCAFPIERVELCDLEATRAAWSRIGKVEAVIHFAARALVPESCERPELYFRNNVLATLNVAEACLAAGITRLVHSSSCAVYGVPAQVPIPESHARHPISPYGESKLMAEMVLDSLVKYRGLRALNLRYFNPAGAIDGGRIGEAHEPETHLIPNVVKAAETGAAIRIFGTDYPTPDGTCIRDFIHVEDLAVAHVLALRYLATAPADGPRAVNVGGGTGSSVREVVTAARNVFGKPLVVEELARRAGDPPRLVAEATLMKKLFGWQPRLGLEDMIRSHAEWERRREKRAR